MLESVCQSGTAAGVISRKGMRDRPCGGKTGTGNDYKDAWFIGFTPYICCGIWIGFDSEETTLNRNYGTGATAALPVWVDFMLKASDIRGYPKGKFQLSDKVSVVLLCKDSNLRATDACPETYPEYYIRGSEPARFCTVHFHGSGGYGPGVRSFSQPGEARPRSRGF